MKLEARDRRALLKERLRSVFAVPHPSPLLIFGNQKSGTSAIAGLMGAASGLRVQIDFRGAWEPYLTPLMQGKTRIADFVRQNAWAFSAPIVKEPCLTFIATALLDHFGCEKGVFIVRNPYQNIRSILDRLGIPGDLKEFHPVPDAVPNRSWRSVMAGSDLGFESDHYISIQARRWQRACEVYLKDPKRYFLVRYEDFSADKKGKVTEILTRFGLPSDRPFETLLDHQFQSKGRPNRDLAKFFGPENLGRIDSICRPYMERLGYDGIGHDSLFPDNRALTASSSRSLSEPNPGS